VHIGLVAGEASGDTLGAALIPALREYFPDVRFSGIGGPKMMALGMESRYPMESLSVMGLIEVIRHLPELLSIRSGLRQYFLQQHPDVVIGIDAPDFNLPLEKSLRSQGIKTVHYVSPTVWAWREGRCKTISQSVDLLLSLYPFETRFLEARHVPATFVGHPLADQIPLQPDRDAAREFFSVDKDALVIAMLPGSRNSEINFLGADFLAAIALLQQRNPGIRCLVPMLNSQLQQRLEAIRDETEAVVSLEYCVGQAHQALSAADVVLTASGTATLEAMLFKRPGVVAYRLNPMTYRIATVFKLVKTPYIALSNLLADECLSPEFIQDEITPEALANALQGFLDKPERREQIANRYQEIHQQLKCDSARAAATSIARLLGNE